jgi:hypothetical protein
LVALSGVATDVRAVEPLATPTGPVVLTITGNIEQTNGPGEARFDKAMLEALGAASIKTASDVADHVQLFEGVPLRAVLDRVGAKGTKMTATALNNYEIVIPFDDLRYEPLLAMQVDGQVLRLRDKGPLWLVYPRDDHKVLQAQMYDSRWVWQLRRLRVE